jgi:HlyD family secretion protein
VNRPAKRRVIWIVAGLAIVAGGIWGYRTYKTRGDGPIEYQTATVTRGDLASQVTASGTLSPLVTVQVGSQVSGRILELYADFNSRVEKGQVIAKIDPQLFQSEVAKANANLTSARASVTRAEAELAQARRNHERTSALASKKLVAQADADTAMAGFQSAEAQVASARAGLSQARAAVEQTKVNLAYTTIVSPISGVVISRNVDRGQTVAASLQAPTLFTIAEDLAKMEVHTSVAESDVGRLAQGMDVEFTVDAFPSDRFHATVKEVRYSPQTVQNVVTYDAVVSVDNRDLKLRPGMTADVTFQIEKRDDALLVPNTALRFRPPPEVLEQIGWKPPEAASPSGARERRPRGDRAPAEGGPTAGGPSAGQPSAGQPSAGQPVAAAGAATPGAGAPGAATASAGRSPLPEARGGEASRTGRRERGGDRASRRLVWKLGANGLPAPAPVQIGISDGRNTEIVSGLAEGETILTGVVGAQAAPAEQNQGGPGGNRGGGRRGGVGRFL